MLGLADTDVPTLHPYGLRRFSELRTDAIGAVTERFYRTHESIYRQYGEKGRDACREDLGFHLEFLRPVLEFGLLSPMVDYLRWLAGVLGTRDIPAEHLAQSLDWLAEFFAAHMDPCDGEAVVAALKAIKSGFQKKDDSLPGIYARMPAPWADCEAFEAALLSGDRRTAAAIMKRLLEKKHSLIDTELHIIQPALYRIGQKWQNNQVSVAQEHLATAIAQSVMVQGLMRSEPAAPNGKKVLLACVENNQHAVGLLMVADAFQLSGWEVNYLGANVPTSALVRHNLVWKPDLVGLSISFPHQLRTVKEVISQMTHTMGDARPPVIIGGLAINNFDPLAGQIGADAWSPDARAAVACGLGLTTPQAPM